METFLAVLARSFTALVLFGLAFFLAKAILRAIPEGRVKAFLSRRYEVVPAVVSPRSRFWSAILLTVVVTWIVCVQVLKALGRLS